MNCSSSAPLLLVTCLLGAGCSNSSGDPGTGGVDDDAAYFIIPEQTEICGNVHIQPAGLHSGPLDYFVLNTKIVLEAAEYDAGVPFGPGAADRDNRPIGREGVELQGSVTMPFVQEQPLGVEPGSMTYIHGVDGFLERAEGYAVVTNEERFAVPGSALEQDSLSMVLSAKVENGANELVFRAPNSEEEAAGILISMRKRQLSPCDLGSNSGEVRYLVSTSAGDFDVRARYFTKPNAEALTVVNYASWTKPNGEVVEQLDPMKITMQESTAASGTSDLFGVLFDADETACGWWFEDLNTFEFDHDTYVPQVAPIFCPEFTLGENVEVFDVVFESNNSGTE